MSKTQELNEHGLTEKEDQGLMACKKNIVSVQSMIRDLEVRLRELKEGLDNYQNKCLHVKVTDESSWAGGHCDRAYICDHCGCCANRQVRY